jgi:hypothetical protein
VVDGRSGRFFLTLVDPKGRPLGLCGVEGYPSSVGGNNWSICGGVSVDGVVGIWTGGGHSTRRRSFLRLMDLVDRDFILRKRNTGEY